MSNTVTAVSDPKLHEILKKTWKADKMRRQNVIGPGGMNYKVFTPDDDTVIFAPQTGLDGTYGQRSTKGLAGE